MMIAVGAIAFWAITAGVIVNIFNIPLANVVSYVSASENGTALKTFCGIVLALLVCRALMARYFEKSALNVQNG